jgi:hypothetical protein
MKKRQIQSISLRTQMASGAKQIIDFSAWGGMGNVYQTTLNSTGA